MKLELTNELLIKHPNLTRSEMRLILRTIWNTKSSKLKRGYIVDFTIPHFGRIKSHGNKKKKTYHAADRKAKRKTYSKKLMEKEKLLF